MSKKDSTEKVPTIKFQEIRDRADQARRALYNVEVLGTPGDEAHQKIKEALDELSALTWVTEALISRSKKLSAELLLVKEQADKWKSKYENECICDIEFMLKEYAYSNDPMTQGALELKAMLLDAIKKVQAPTTKVAEVQKDQVFQFQKPTNGSEYYILPGNTISTFHRRPNCPALKNSQSEVIRLTREYIQAHFNLDMDPETFIRKNFPKATLCGSCKRHMSAPAKTHDSGKIISFR